MVAVHSGGGLKGHESVRWRVFKAETSEQLERCKNRGSGEYRPPYRLGGTWIATPASSGEEIFPKFGGPHSSRFVLKGYR